MMTRKCWSSFISLVLIAALVGFCLSVQVAEGKEAISEKPKDLNIALISVTIIEHPWNAAALQSLERVKKEKPRWPAIHWPDGRAAGDKGVPDYIRSDNGPEFTSRAVRCRLSKIGVKTLFIEPGSPWENGYRGNPFSATNSGNTFLASKSFQDYSDFFFRRIFPPSLPPDFSNNSFSLRFLFHLSPPFGGDYT